MVPLAGVVTEKLWPVLRLRVRRLLAPFAVPTKAQCCASPEVWPPVKPVAVVGVKAVPGAGVIIAGGAVLPAENIQPTSSNSCLANPVL